MKRVICFVLVVLLALSGTTYAHATLSRAQEEILIYPVLEQGDRAALSDRALDMTFQLDGHLYWDCDFRFAGNETDTGFRFVREQEQDAYRQRQDFTVDAALNFGASTNGSLLTYRNPYGELFKDLIAKTPDGETATQMLNLADYVDYYQPTYEVMYESDTVYAYFALSSSGILAGHEMYQDLRDYKALTDNFRFPVRAEEPLEVSITKDTLGNVSQFGMSAQRGLSLYFWTAMDDNGVYFLPVFQDEDGTPLPYESPRGHGVYFAPWIPEANGGLVSTTHGQLPMSMPDMANARLLCPLEQFSIVEAELDPAANRIWVLTQDDSHFSMTTIDMATGAILAQNPVLPRIFRTVPTYAPDGTPDGGHVLESEHAAFDRQGDYLLVTSDSTLALLDSVGKPLLTAPFDEAGSIDNYSPRNFHPDQGAIRYDGETLILADFGYWGDTVAFWTGVYTEGKQLYYGEYACSLHRSDNSVQPFGPMHIR